MLKRGLYLAPRNLTTSHRQWWICTVCRFDGRWHSRWPPWSTNVSMVESISPMTAVTVSFFSFFFNTDFCVEPYVPSRTPKGPKVIVGSMNMGHYIRQCQESNSQPVPSQAGARYHKATIPGRRFLRSAAHLELTVPQTMNNYFWSACLSWIWTNGLITSSCRAHWDR